VTVSARFHGRRASRAGAPLCAALALLAACATPLERRLEHETWFEARLGTLRLVSDLGAQRTAQPARAR
jgi:hypothetical protein